MTNWTGELNYYVKYIVCSLQHFGRLQITRKFISFTNFDCFFYRSKTDHDN